MNKRGITVELSFIIFSIFIVSFVALTIILYVNNVSKGVDFKEKYIAIDTGLLLNTIYSSPGNLEISYNLGYFYSYNLNTKDGNILINYKDNELGKKFMFTPNRAFSIEDKKLDAQVLVFRKNESRIDVNKNE